MKFKNVLVVGGGSSGWMTAAAFCKFFKPEENVKVSLVESKNIKRKATIEQISHLGLGESVKIIHLLYLFCENDLQDAISEAQCSFLLQARVSFRCVTRLY